MDHRSQVTSWTDPRLSQQPQGQQQQQKPDVRGEFNDRSAGALMSATVTSATATAAAASSSKPFKPTGTWVSSSDFGHARLSQACRLWVGDGVLARRLHVYTAVLALLLLVLCTVLHESYISSPLNSNKIAGKVGRLFSLFLSRRPIIAGNDTYLARRTRILCCVTHHVVRAIRGVG